MPRLRQLAEPEAFSLRAARPLPLNSGEQPQLSHSRHCQLPPIAMNSQPRQLPYSCIFAASRQPLSAHDAAPRRAAAAIDSDDCRRYASQGRLQSARRYAAFAAAIFAAKDASHYAAS